VNLSGQGDLINKVKNLEMRDVALNKNYNDIEGSPYYNNEFVQSTAYLKDGNFASLPLRYDLFQDEMEFRRDGKIRWMIKRDIKYIRFGTEMIVVSSATGDTSKLGYFFLKETGKYLLFYRKSVIFLPYIQPKGYIASVPDRFDRPVDEIFIKQENIAATKIKTRKDLLSYFADQKAALSYIKKERIKADDIEDLSKLIRFLNGN
jgi:hypothetical protein